MLTRSTLDIKNQSLSQKSKTMMRGKELKATEDLVAETEVEEKMVIASQEEVLKLASLRKELEDAETAEEVAEVVIESQELKETSHQEKRRLKVMMLRDQTPVETTIEDVTTTTTIRENNVHTMMLKSQEPTDHRELEVSLENRESQEVTVKEENQDNPESQELMESKDHQDNKESQESQELMEK